METICLNQGWRCNGQPVNLPHDAQITEPCTPEGFGGHGYYPGGIYTYEKVLTIPDRWAGKNLLLEFEGVYKNATVCLNGREICFHPYGYTGFFVDLTGLQPGTPAVLTVTADNSQLPNSRWYSGAGIYRPVWLHVCEPSGLRPGCVKIRTVSHSPAAIRVTAPLPVRVETAGVSGEGTDFCLTIPDARLWSAEDPYLYTARVCAGETDRMEVSFGIRTIRWGPDGLFINGQETLLRGGCLHHDSGILGAATYDESEERRARILKAQGFNAIRSSHNPASRALLEACDRVGLYVMDETFDMWYNRKNRFDYGLDWKDHWREDTTAMVERDFNHPCVILYSIGNEVAEPCEARGLTAAREQAELCRRLDDSRPVTCGANLTILAQAAKGKGIYRDGGQAVGGGTHPEKEGQNASLLFNMMASFVGSGMNKGGNSRKVDALSTPFLDTLDIVGYNYGSGRYPLDGKAHPERVVFGSETFPQDIYKNWQMVERYPYLIGDFMWTAWDYLGEAGLGAWSYSGGMPFNRPYPWRLAGAGVIDILGNSDASCRYASVVWGQLDGPVLAVRPVNHPGVRPSKSVWRGTNAIQSWSWAGCEGNPAVVEVYARAHSVELLLDGRRLGRKVLRQYKALFRVRYAPGVLTAVARDEQGRETGRTVLRSAAAPVHPVIRPETGSVRPGGLLFAAVNLEDTSGVVESNGDRLLTVSAEGGRLLAFGSAAPCTEESYHTGRFTTWYGRALAIVQAGESGQVVLTVRDGATTVQRSVPIQ